MKKTDRSLKGTLSFAAAALLAVGVGLMHGLSGYWVPSIFPEFQKPITESLQIGPWGKLFLMGYLALSLASGIGVVLLMTNTPFRGLGRFARPDISSRNCPT